MKAEKIRLKRKATFDDDEDDENKIVQNSFILLYKDNLDKTE